MNKSLKINKNQWKTPPDNHLAPARAPRRSKYLKKTSGRPFYRILGVPWDPFGKPKISKKSKKCRLKIDEKSEGFQRASQSRFRPIWGGQKLQNEVKNESEMNLGSEKTDFCKSAYFIAPADAAEGQWRVVRGRVGRLRRCRCLLPLCWRSDAQIVFFFNFAWFCCKSWQKFAERIGVFDL